MKNWTLFKWAVSRLEFKDGHCQKNLRNYILTFLMTISGVKPKDVKALWYTEDYTFINMDLA